MPTPPDDEQTPWYQHVPAILIMVLTGAFVIGLPFLLMSSGDTSPTTNRMFLGGAFGTLMVLAWLDSHLDSRRRRRLWRQVAEQAGLTNTAQGTGMGAFVFVSGQYRGRRVTLYAPRVGRGQAIATRVEVLLTNPVAAATLRMRGPFARNTALCDSVTSNLFATTDARMFGDAKRFFVRSKPVHLITRLLATHPLWENLEDLDRLVNIELSGQVLWFEQLGLLREPDRVRQMFDLLCEMADTIEHTLAIGKATAEHAA